MKKHEWTEALGQLINDLKLTDEESIFKIHPIYRVGVKSLKNECLRDIFGESTIRRWKNFGKNFVKFPWPNLRFKANLPADSVIFFREKKEGLIAVSKEQNFVLKVFLSPEYSHLLEEEIQTLKDFQGTDFHKYIPQLLDHGKTKNGGVWMKMSFHSNSHSLKNLVDSSDYLIQNKELILKPLFSLYKSSGFKLVSIQQWMDSARKRIQKHPASKDLEFLLEKIPNFTHDLIQTRIHHDVHVNNVLVGGDGHPVFIDWEGKIEGATLVDYFDLSRRYIGDHKIVADEFWKFMKGEGNPPKKVLDFFNYYRRSSLENFKAIVSPETHRSTYVIYTIERTLLLYEKRGVNRLNDTNGFETKVLKSVQ